MDQRSALLGMFLFIIVLFGGLVAYDMYTNNRLDSIIGDKQETNYPWSDNWKNNETPVTPDKPDSPVVPEAQPKQQIVADNYDDALKKSGQLGMPVFVYFHADWCSWCKKMKSETLADPKVRIVLKNYIVVYVNTDSNRRIASKHGVASLPSYVITNHKEASLKKGAGYQSADKFASWLDNPNLYKQPKLDEQRNSPDEDREPRFPRRPDDNRRPRNPG